MTIISVTRNQFNLWYIFSTRFNILNIRIWCRITIETTYFYLTTNTMYYYNKYYTTITDILFINFSFLNTAGCLMFVG